MHAPVEADTRTPLLQNLRKTVGVVDYPRSIFEFRTQQSMGALSGQKRIILAKFKRQKDNSRYHTKIGDNLNRLPELDLLQFLSLRYAPACILTVNRRLLSARSRHSAQVPIRAF